LFTGIIEELGSVRNIHTHGNTLIMSIQAKKILQDINLGDSISVNGVCLTVTDFNNQTFLADVMPETFKSTSLSTLKQGGLVNLERAISSKGRFGGHFVTGHVDAVGKILKMEPQENAIYIDISIPKEYSPPTEYKGSISLDGTSLTIYGTKNNIVTVSIIPYTAKESVLGSKKTGDVVNIEFDIIGKYIHSYLTKDNQGSGQSIGITSDFLKENGFL
jgi:riboflavin synthase